MVERDSPGPASLSHVSRPPERLSSDPVTRRAALAAAGGALLAALGTKLGSRGLDLPAASAHARHNRHGNGRNRNRRREKSVSIPGQPGTPGSDGQVIVNP